MNDLLTPADLQAFMEQQGIPGEILILAVATPTVDAAAQAVGAPPQQIVKSVLFSLPAENVLTISCGDQLVERRVIANLYGISRKRVKLASPEEVVAITGYAVGTIPPFGHRQPIPTLLDQRVLEFTQVYAGGGAHNALVSLNPQDILTITRPQVIDLHTPPA